VSVLGVSPTLIRTLRAAGGVPAQDLGSVRVLGSTGEPWDPESYEWLARDVFGSRVPIINFSGGTEVGGSFLCPYPVEEIRSCSLGGPALGMDVDVVDDAARPVRGEIGELVCRQPWPSMTRGIWNDDEAGSRYHEAYWDTFDGLWRHGDFALVDIQVLSPVPPLIVDWADPGPGRDWAVHVDAGIAALVAQYPDRFVGLGTIPLSHPESAVEVLEQIAEVGLRGVEIGCSADGVELDAPQLRPVFEAAARLGLVVFVHPLLLGARADWTDRIVGQEIAFGLGMPTDTAIAATRLAFGGVTADLPGLRVLLAHGGGTFFWSLPRIARLWNVQERPSAAELTKNVYCDSVVYQPRLIAALRDQIGADG
jgi:predicted TIM-barrel fold metal-dependent hydrolase